jgi:hypothetical protein
MVRPGLEPGTPRFSGTLNRRVEDAGLQGDAAERWRRDACGFLWIRVGLGHEPDPRGLNTGARSLATGEGAPGRGQRGPVVLRCMGLEVQEALLPSVEEEASREPDGVPADARSSSQAGVSGARAETFALQGASDRGARRLSAGRRLRVLDALGDLARELEQATRDPVIREIADAHGRTPGQVALRCLLDQPSSRQFPRCRSSRPAVFEVSASRSNRARSGRVEAALTLTRGLRNAQHPLASGARRPQQIFPRFAPRPCPTGASPFAPVTHRSSTGASARW